jgi:hypothetical protein
MEDIEQKAQELVNLVSEQIKQEQTKLAQEMIAKGYTPDMYAIEHNLEDVIEDPTIPYKCNAVLRPTRFTRGHQ